MKGQELVWDLKLIWQRPLKHTNQRNYNYTNQRNYNYTNTKIGKQNRTKELQIKVKSLECKYKNTFSKSVKGADRL